MNALDGKLKSVLTQQLMYADLNMRIAKSTAPP